MKVRFCSFAGNYQLRITRISGRQLDFDRQNGVKSVDFASINLSYCALTCKISSRSDKKNVFPRFISHASKHRFWSMIAFCACIDILTFYNKNVCSLEKIRLKIVLFDRWRDKHLFVYFANLVSMFTEFIIHFNGKKIFLCFSYEKVSVLIELSSIEAIADNLMSSHNEPFHEYIEHPMNSTKTVRRKLWWKRPIF